MNKEEFLRELKGALITRIDDFIIEENISYYEKFFNEQTALGKSEAEICDMLGNPRLIAKTILEVKKDESVESEYASESSYDNSYEREDNTYQKGFHAEYNNEGGLDIKFGRFKLNSWYGALLLVLIVFLFLALLWHIFIILLPIVLLIVGVCTIVKIVCRK